LWSWRVLRNQFSVGLWYYHRLITETTTPKNMIEISKETKDEINAKRNEIEFCPLCGASIKDRTISLYKGLIDALYAVYCWCGEKRKHEFETKEIKHLLGMNEYARFGDLVRFGGIVYKPEGKEKAHFGINMKRARDFFHGEYQIPMQITLNQITNEIINATYVKVDDFPSLVELFNEEGTYDHEKVIHAENIDWEKQNKAGLKPVSEQTKLFQMRENL
jgi:hypothetical protein